MKKIALIVLISILGLVFPTFANAFTSVSRSDSNFDETISDQSARQYIEPGYIFITQIKSYAEDYSLNPEEWIQSLYYYFITRLGYLDLPYTYIIDRDGEIYEGRNGGVSVDPETVKKNGTLVIGYLSNTPDVTFGASQSMKQVINELSYRYGIEKKDVSVGDLTISKEGEISKSTLTPKANEFSSNVTPILSTCAYYKYGNIEYKAEVKGVTYPSSVKSTEKMTVSLTIVNKNDFPWFTAKDYIYLSTSNFKDSLFAVNGQWESFSKPYAISDRVIMPNEEVQISFDMQAVVLPGRYTQKFVLTKLPKNIFEGSAFTVNVRVIKGNYDLVKVVGIPSLNVRDCAGPNCHIISQVGENQILVMLDKSVGWYNIRYSGNKSGWVYGKYIQEL